MALTNKTHPMKNRKPFLSRLADGFSRLWAALKSHPVELLVLLHAAASAFLNGNPWWQQSSSYAAIAVVAAFCVSRFRKGMNWAQWVYFALLPLYALTALLPDAWPKTTEFAILNFLLPFAYLLTYPTWEDGRFSERFYRLLRSLAVSVGIAGILYVLLLLVVASVDLLFHINSGYRFEMASANFCFILLAPMLFISLESQEEPPAVILFVEITINYVLTPILLLYNTILYVYLGVILVNWNLPQSSVSTMVLAFTLVAIAIRLVRPLLAKQPLKWYFRWFSLFALPLVALFWVAVSYRIGQYGVTVDRCILVVVGVLMTLYLIALLILNSQLSIVNYLTTALVVLCGVVLTVGGPLSARQVSLRSQMSIVREKAALMGILAPDGKLDTTLELFFRTPADTANIRNHRAVYQAMKYLEEISDTSTVRATLGMTAANYLDHLSQPTSNFASAYAPDEDGYDTIESISVIPHIVYLSMSDRMREMDISGYKRMMVGGNVEGDKEKYILYPGGRIPADSLLATQLAKIGCTLTDPLTESYLELHKDELCCYRSPDSSVLILFDQLSIECTDSLNTIAYARIHCALSK